MRAISHAMVGTLALLCSLLLQRGAAQQIEELAVIVHPAVPVAALGQADLASVFTGVRKTWPDGSRVVPFNLAARSDFRVAFDRAVLGLGPDEIARMWIDKRIRGEGTPPRQIGKPELARAVVAATRGGISYVPVRLVKEGVRMVARIRAGRVVAP
jgi:hypothetical protein